MNIIRRIFAFDRLFQALKQEFGLLAQVWLGCLIVWRNTPHTDKTIEWHVVTRPNTRYIG